MMKTRQSDDSLDYGYGLWYVSFMDGNLKSNYNPGQSSWDIEAMTYYLFPLPLMQCWCQAFKSISVDSTLLGGRGDKRNGLLKQHCQPFLRGGFRVYLTKCNSSLNFHICPMMFWPGLSENLFGRKLSFKLYETGRIVTDSLVKYRWHDIYQGF